MENRSDIALNSTRGGTSVSFLVWSRAQDAYTFDVQYGGEFPCAEPISVTPEGSASGGGTGNSTSNTTITFLRVVCTTTPGVGTALPFSLLIKDETGSAALTSEPSSFTVFYPPPALTNGTLRLLTDTSGCWLNATCPSPLQLPVGIHQVPSLIQNPNLHSQSRCCLCLPCALSLF